MRTALDAGDPRGAIAVLDKEMDVQSPSELPKDMGSSDNALFVLDRGSIQQSVAAFDRSKVDFESADKAIDMLDLAHDAKDTIGEYVFSGSSGKYQAPPYEKLLVNTLDMINYLEQRDLNGARVEARRLAVMQKYIADDLRESDNAVLGLGGFLAGYTFEKSESSTRRCAGTTRRSPFTGFHSLQGPVRELLGKSQYRSPRLRDLEASAPDRLHGGARRSELGRDRLRRRLRPRAAQDRPAHPHRPRAHHDVGSAVTGKRGGRQPPRGAGPRHVDQLTRRSGPSGAGTPFPRACSTAGTCSSKRL